jgi:phosphoserine phosphatase
MKKLIVFHLDGTLADAEMSRLLHDLVQDYPAEQAGVVSMCVRGPHETKRVIQMSIACLSDHGQEVVTL